ncbi:DUF5060 domain-containing protein [Pontibacter sp. G13]|uniref:DUF5060 domain-containing protein n=1 Tax=Pontibacter sp. G13 TaxID=3074898 RepID=UPI002889E8B3|nr:DUF5060 domain-containing protein [Pontibacter sp. G13]WNJ19117.1 DUF5060 domain-containing protein [Pontibacter sp. G13]
MHVRFSRIMSVLCLLAFLPTVRAQDLNNPLLKDHLVLAEQDGILAGEAEHFSKQTSTQIRRWYTTSLRRTPNITPDADTAHLADASGGAYLEILPDSRQTHDDDLIVAENFMNEPGKMAILHYPIFINTPGRYYVWVRTHSTGTEDNGIHVGIDGTWPEHGRRMQWTAKRTWAWGCKQRTQEVHTGVPMEIYLDIEEAGMHELTFSMREDGFEFDKFVLALDKEFRPEGQGPKPTVKEGTIPPAIAKQQPAKPDFRAQIAQQIPGAIFLPATEFPHGDNKFYQHKQWLALNPKDGPSATTSLPAPVTDGSYDILLLAVGENDGKSQYRVQHGNAEIGTYTAPLSKQSFETGVAFTELWEGIELKKGQPITITATLGSEDGQEYSRARWAGLVIAPITKGKDVLTVMEGKALEAPVEIVQQAQPKYRGTAKQYTPGTDGDGSVEISGELKRWHKVTLTMDGPFAAESDTEPNPFMDYRMEVTFTHASGSPSYQVPAYFAADGDAGESSADQGNKWRAHLSPDKIGEWTYQISFTRGEQVAVLDVPWAETIAPFDGMSGSFTITETDKTGRDFRAHGRLEYVGKHHLQFAGSKQYFLKAGADAPETLLAYVDFDNTVARKKNVPLKEYLPHRDDWQEGDPTWKDGKGKNLIGAIHYLSDKGVNVCSFLTYNAGGDGDNVWPFIDRDDKYHYDCSKLDQWGIVFDYAQSMGMYLHFKTQETEIDDNLRGKKHKGRILESLDGGQLGPQRRLYYRELVARFGYLNVLNWNLGEENTQTFQQRQDMAAYFDQLDPYPHNIVLHTYPNQQEQVYPPLLGTHSLLTGLSLQNHWNQVFDRTLRWVKASAESGRPWVIANDEQGSAGEGIPPDPGYNGFNETSVAYTIHDVRKQTLWGNLMAGGAGVEYYFGYKLPENDLIAQDFRSRDQSWDYCRHALEFFQQNEIPFQDMTNHDELIDNADYAKDKHCLAIPGEQYLVYLAYTETSTLDLSGVEGKFDVYWYNPRKGGALKQGRTKTLKGGKVVNIGLSPNERTQDWVVWIKRRN